MAYKIEFIPDAEGLKRSQRKNPEYSLIAKHPVQHLA